MAENHVLYNGSPTSVVYDAAGHALDAGDRIEGNPNGQILSKLIETGQLPDLGPVADPDATDEEQPADDAAPTDETGE